MTTEFPLEAPAPRRPPLTRPVVTGLLGVLVGAILVGVPWLAFTLFGGGGGGRPLKAPDTLGGLPRTQAAAAKPAGDKPSRAQQQIDRTDRTDRENAARVSAAYGGAAAVSQSYNDDDFRRGYQLIAVRAVSPELIAPYQDVASMGLAAPETELKQVGAVQCLQHNQPTPAGQAPDPERSIVTNCQRTGPGLTVQVRITSNEDAHDATAIAAATEEAWQAFTR